jgi:hypothetical protein
MRTRGSWWVGRAGHHSLHKYLPCKPHVCNSGTAMKLYSRSSHLGRGAACSLQSSIILACACTLWGTSINMSHVPSCIGAWAGGLDWDSKRGCQGPVPACSATHGVSRSTLWAGLQVLAAAHQHMTILSSVSAAASAGGKQSRTRRPCR